MCGISAIVNKLNSKVEFNDIQRMTNIISHRGPDAESFFIEGNFALGHRRLSIIDLSKEGTQPFISDDGNYVIIYNGEIYNYLELKEELIQQGVNFKTKTDTEVIIYSYKLWGESCVNRFNGMWAFSIYDKKKNILFCSRDRFGVKPFYYYDDGKHFYVASEIKQFIPFIPQPKVNKEILADYLVFGLEEHKPMTFFLGVTKLLGGHNLIYKLNSHEYEIKKYYDLQIKNLSGVNQTEVIEEFKDLFTNSIEVRMRSDVKVGTCLSGGLDSSSIATIASNLYVKNEKSDKFIGINAKSTLKENDESDYAKLVAKDSDIHLEIVEPQIEDFYNTFEEIIHTQDEPFGGPSLFMQYKVFEKAKQIGCTVMLDGQGGDELLLGYERYFSSIWWQLGFIPKITSIFNVARKSRSSILKFIGYIIYFNFPILRIWRQKRRWAFLNSSFLQEADSKFIFDCAKANKNIADLQKMEYLKIQLPHLLKHEDRNSMKHGIETRLPFVDYRLVEYSLGIPNVIKHHDGWSKYILRLIMDDKLNQEVCWRKEKFGFEAPEKTWLKDRNYFKTLLSNSELIKCITKEKFDIQDLDNNQFWKLINVAMWEKVFKVKF